MKSKMILLTALISALVCVQARADLIAPFGTLSVIDGHGPNGTHQTWDSFSTGTPSGTVISGILADHDDNPYGTPTALIEALPEIGETDVLGPLVADGTVYASPRMQIVLYIPNTINPDLLKIVQATLVYKTQDNPESGLEPGGAFLVPEGDSAIDPVAGLETIDADGWRTLTLEWQFPQLYASEQITLLLHDSGVLLDSIVVETQCVPLPGAVLLGLLGLAAAGRKLRKAC